jgi:hypothetical protein
MRTILFLFVTALFVAPCQGQITKDNDSVRFDYSNKRLGSDGLKRYPSLSDRKLFEQEASAKRQTPLNAINRHDSIIEDNRLNLYIPDFYIGPTSNYLASPLVNPYVDDYSYSAIWGLSDRSWINTYSGHETYPLIGSLTEIDAMYNYMLTDNLTVSAGAYIARYRYGIGINNDMGVNAALKYTIGGRFGIHAFGQFSGFAKKNGLNTLDRTGMFPATNYGAALEVKITDWIGVMGGVKRELNPMTGKWKNIPFIMPVFYSK